ncbi:shikimate dehydrogenase [Betaproteobacteria bacterium GR16-43]|nr:shikimate dehydrogenase [Betaproteobacteria bacterium GR16-43]
MIRGTTRLIAHLGYPIDPVKAPMIYNPYFEHHRIDAAVVPMGVEARDFAAVLGAVFRLTNIVGALVTMPHKVTTASLLDVCSDEVRTAGSCNAVRRREDGSLVGDMFDGAGFVLGLRRKGFVCEGARCLVVGAGGVGSAIAAALAGAGVKSIALFDLDEAASKGLRRRLADRYPGLEVTFTEPDPAGHDLVVNATPLGMHAEDALPLDASKLAPSTFVGEVVMKQEITPLLRAARGIGCRTQVGTDMLFEQIPLYLKFFGLRDAGPEELRALARLA